MSQLIPSTLVIYRFEFSAEEHFHTETKESSNDSKNADGMCLLSDSPTYLLKVPNAFAYSMIFVRILAI